jgi:hypothetical protein
MLPIEFARYRFSLQNPFPPVDRRYQMAKACLAHRMRPSLRFDDEYTWNVYRFLRARAAFRQPAEHVKEVLWKYRDLNAAVQIHHGKARSFRPVLEAYLLARENRYAIAESLRVNPETVVAYAKTFFDAEPFLDNPMYVFALLVGTVGKRGQKKLTEPVLWKLLGYVGGPEALDKLFGKLHGVAESHGEEGIKGWLSVRTQTVLQIKQLLAVSSLKSSNTKHMEYLLRLLGQGQRSKGDGPDAPLTSVEMHVKGMLGEILWSVGVKDVPAPLEGWVDQAAELRADEEMKLMAGVDVPGLDEVKDLHIPLSRETLKSTPPGQPPGK